MKSRVVTSLREFDGLEPVWGHVVTEGGVRSPFLSHDWFACCWRTAGPNRRREVSIVEDDAGPVGLFPLVWSREKVRGLPVRTLRFMDGPDTPFCDFPVARAQEEAVAAFLDSLVARRDWDVLVLPKLRVAAPTVKLLESLLPSRFHWRVATCELSPYVSLSGSWESFFRSKSQRFRKTYRNIENRLQRAGGVTIEEHREVDPHGPVFSELIDVSTQSWKGPRALAIATMQGMRRFFQELTRRASARGWLRLWILRLDGQAIATEYQLADQQSVHALRSDFNLDAADFSPGARLNGAIIRSLFERRGVIEYDMGPGTNDYKMRWATGVHESVGLEIYASTPMGRVLHEVETRFVPLVRRWRAHLQRTGT